MLGGTNTTVTGAQTGNERTDCYCVNRLSVDTRAQLSDTAWLDSGIVPPSVRDGTCDNETIDPATGAVRSVADRHIGLYTLR